MLLLLLRFWTSEEKEVGMVDLWSATCAQRYRFEKTRYECRRWGAVWGCCRSLSLDGLVGCFLEMGLSLGVRFRE